MGINQSIELMCTESIDLNPIARVTGKSTKSGDHGVIHDVTIAAMRPHDLEQDDSMYSGRQVVEIERQARAAGVAEANKYAAEAHRLDLNNFEKRLNGVYSERNHLAVALARMVLIHNDDPNTGYSFDEKTGRAVVYVTLPMGHQVSWHMSDTMTESFKGLGPKPLPKVDTKWDGTYLGRERGWPVKYVRTEMAFCDQATAIRSVAGAPTDATHYRVCSGGKIRHYKKHPTDGEWQYFHADGQMWHPTDLSADYLASHIKEIGGLEPGSSVGRLHPLDAAALMFITSTTRPKHMPVFAVLPDQRVSRETAILMLYHYDAINSEECWRKATHVAMPQSLNEIMPPIFFRVVSVAHRPDEVEWFDVTSGRWLPSAARACWIRLNTHLIVDK